MEVPAFEWLITKFIDGIRKPVYAYFVTKFEITMILADLLRDGVKFRSSRTARCVTDVAFQQTNRPKWEYSRRKYYSSKPKLYRFIVEVVFLPNGIAINCTNHYSGLISDLANTSNIRFQKLALRRNAGEREVMDTGILVGEYARQLSALKSKGYQIVAWIVRAVILKKSLRTTI